MKLSITVFPLLFLLLASSSGYRILGLFAFNGKSHFMMFETLMKGLARKGHQVDVIGNFPLKKPYPNYTDIVVLQPERHFVNNFAYKDIIRVTNIIAFVGVATIGGNDICALMADPNLREFIRNPPKDPPYDAVIMEVFGAQCFAIIPHLLNVPLIGVSSSAMYPWLDDIVANPGNLAFMANNLVPLPKELNFWNRLANVFHTHINKRYFYDITTPVQDRLIKQLFGEDMPGVRELEKNVSIILVNSHISLTGIRPISPAVIEVGGLHVHDEDVEVPIELEKWMNESIHGFVYFSFGSMVMIESFPRHNIDTFYASLSKITPVRVLMKVANASLLPPGLPKNIYTSPWMPQEKILKHRNIKAFITHGGLMGSQEAIHYGVPMIGVPLFADQFINIETYVEKNIAVKLDIKTLTVEKMDEALNAVLKNPIYRETMKNVSRLFLDRPMSPIDTAIYWVEYVIRNGPDVMRSQALKLAWWQIELLDVYAFIIVVVLVIVWIAVAMLKVFLRAISLYYKSAIPLPKKIN